jgi:hypothetical protein
LAAVVNGRSVDTTMGFTRLEGLVMATRSGSVDPGLLLWLEEHEHLKPHDVATALEERSGLLALAGTADMREVEAAAGRDEPDARLALDVYTHHLVAGVAAIAAASGGLVVLAFTGGVGERSAGIRRRAAGRLSYLGIGLTPSEISRSSRTQTSPQMLRSSERWSLLPEKTFRLLARPGAYSQHRMVLCVAPMAAARNGQGAMQITPTADADHSEANASSTASSARWATPMRESPIP